MIRTFDLPLRRIYFLADKSNNFNILQPLTTIEN